MYNSLAYIVYYITRTTATRVLDSSTTATATTTTTTSTLPLLLLLLSL